MAPEEQRIRIPAGLDSHGRRFSDEILSALSRVPRERFVPEAYANQAYEDKALPIGLSQTISQPFIVALMSEEARVGAGSRVLEVGTGSGYQSAVLRELGAEVFTIEFLPKLSARAEQLLGALGYSSIKFRAGDGFLGWPEEAPFDAILVTASSPGYPPELLRELSPGGRLLIPLETEEGEERLKLLVSEGGTHQVRDLGPVRFVPLVGLCRET